MEKKVIIGISLVVLFIVLISVGGYFTGNVVSDTDIVEENGIIGSYADAYNVNCPDDILAYYGGDFLDGIVASNVDSVDGKIGEAYGFAGNKESVIVIPTFNINQAKFSFSAWIKTGKKNKAILSVAESNGKDNSLLVLSSGYIYVKESRKSVKHNLADNEWHYLAVTIDSDNRIMKVYIDGSLFKEVKISRNAINSKSIVLGQDQDRLLGGFQKKQSFSGLMDEIVFYNKVLSDEEIAGYYNNGNGVEACEVSLNEDFGKCEIKGSEVYYNGNVYQNKFCFNSSILREISCANDEMIVNDTECNCLNNKCVVSEAENCELLISTLNHKHNCVDILGFKSGRKKYIKLDVPEKCSNRCLLRFDVYMKNGKSFEKIDVVSYNFRQTGNSWESSAAGYSSSGVNGNNIRERIASGMLVFYDDYPGRENSENQVLLYDDKCGDFETEIYVCDAVAGVI